MLGNKFCECGCKELIPIVDNRNRPRKYVSGHAKKGKLFIYNKESKSHRTGRSRARKITDVSRCFFENEKFCSKRIEVHHKDGNPLNNNPKNLVPVCTTHHRFLESKKITLKNSKLPDFYISSNKRRYLWNRKK